MINLNNYLGNINFIYWSELILDMKSQGFNLDKYKVEIYDIFFKIIEEEKN